MDKAQSKTESEKIAIVELINNNDTGAFPALYQVYWDRLLEFAARYLNDRESCKEIVQELFIQLHLNKLPLNLKSSVSSYLYSAVRNRAYNHIRNHSVYRRHIQTASGKISHSQNNVEQRLSYKELEAKINKILAGLPKRYREAYELRQTERYPVKKIASTLNRPVNTVEKQIRKVHGILKEQLAVYRLTD